MRKMNEERIEDIKEYLLMHQKATVGELSQEFKVTKETIRKDLTYLEDRRFLFRTHGGAIIRNSNVDVPMELRAQEKIDVKRKISVAANKLIKNDDVVFFDPSSTSLPMGKLIRLKSNLIVVTNGLDMLLNLIDYDGEVFFLGGIYSATGRRIGGQFPMAMIEKFNFDISFFGSDGVEGLDGPGTHSKDAIEMNELVMARSKTNVLLMDSSKFSLSSRFQYAKFSDFDYIITEKVPEGWENRLDAKHIIIAD
jgi:DeoR/GlpR family transcriptional regulator of sugar metabolism